MMAIRSSLIVLGIVLILSGCTQARIDYKTKSTAEPVTGGGSPRSSVPRFQVSEVELGSALDEDSLYRSPGIRNAFQAIYLHPVSGGRLWQNAEQIHTQENIPMSEALTRVALQPEVRPIFMSAVETDLKEKSNYRKDYFRSIDSHRQINHHQSNSSLKSYHVIIVGAGPSGALAALKMRELNPALKIALVDSMELPGSTFRNFGLMSWMNSPELPSATTNPFPGLPFTAKHLLHSSVLSSTGPVYFLPEVIADLTTLAVFRSGVDYFSETDVRDINLSRGRVSFVFHPDFENGEHQELRVEMTAEKVLFASGLGDTEFYGREDLDNNMVSQLNDTDTWASPVENPPGVEHFNRITKRITDLIRSNRQLPVEERVPFLEAYRGRRIAIVGKGDAANNLAEILTGFGQPEVYGHLSLNARAIPIFPDFSVQPGTQYGPSAEQSGLGQVYWIHQDPLEPVQFRENNKPRYHVTLGRDCAQNEGGRCAPLNTFETHPERLQDITFHDGDGRRRYTLDLEDEEPIEVDHVWFATGTQMSGRSALRTIVPPRTGGLRGLMDRVGSSLGMPWSDRDVRRYISTLDVVLGQVEGIPHETALGRRINPNFYLGGNAAGELATPEELESFTTTHNQHSLDSNSKRLVSLATHIVGEIQLGERNRFERVPILLGPEEELDPVEQGELRSQWSEFNTYEGFSSLDRIVSDFPAEVEAKRSYLEAALRLQLAEVLKPFSVTASFSIRFGQGAQEDSSFFQVAGLTPESRRTLVRQFWRNRAFVRLAEIYSSLDGGAESATCFNINARSYWVRHVSPSMIDIEENCR